MLPSLLLACREQFDRDYLDFQSAIHDVETMLQGFINNSFETFQNTHSALHQLQRFQNVITRETLRADLENKHMVSSCFVSSASIHPAPSSQLPTSILLFSLPHQIHLADGPSLTPSVPPPRPALCLQVIFQNYGLDLDFVQRQYEKYKTNPPKVYNFPPVAGNITWCRQLLRRIEEPMKRFQSNKSIMSTKESKKIIRTYNRVARALVEFETLWHQAWCKSIDAAKSGLAATLFVKPPNTSKLYANFDHEILQLIRETRCLLRLHVEVPEGAKMVLMQDAKFKHYHGRIIYTLKEYDRVLGRIYPIIKPLLLLHLEDLDAKMQPALSTLTWTSLNIETFLGVVEHGLFKLDDLVTKMSDMIDNRIEHNLKIIGRTVLVDLDEDKFPFQATRPREHLGACWGGL